MYGIQNLAFLIVVMKTKPRGNQNVVQYSNQNTHEQIIWKMVRDVYCVVVVRSHGLGVVAVAVVVQSQSWPL